MAYTNPRNVVNVAAVATGGATQSAPANSPQRGPVMQERFEFESGGEPIVGNLVAMPLREAYEFYGTARGAVPNYVNGFAVQSNAYLLPFDAMGVATAMKTPVLIVHSERALLPDLAKHFHAKLTAPKQELWLQSQGQIDFYDDPTLIAAATAAAATWFVAYR